MRLGLSANYFPDILLPETLNSNRWSVTADICKEIANLGKTKNTPVLFVFFPGPYQVNENLGKSFAKVLGIDWANVDLMQPSRLLAAEFLTRGLKFIDMTFSFREKYASGERDLYGEIDNHFGLNGHKIVAEVITPFVISYLKNTQMDLISPIDQSPPLQ